MSTRHGPVPAPAPVLAVLLLALGACGGAHAPLPEELRGTERLRVEGRQGWMPNQRLRFGSWEAVGVDRSGVGGRDFRVAAVSGSRRAQEYAFTLRADGRDAWRVECLATLRTRSLDVRVGTIDPVNATTLDCDLRPVDGGEAWRLALGEEGERAQAGMLGSGGRSLAVVGTNRLEGGLPTRETTGFHVAEDGRTLAAVETLGDGAVWLRPGLDPGDRGLVAAAAAALLLAEDLRRTLPADPGPRVFRSGARALYWAREHQPEPTDQGAECEY
ncbi:MAG TPA: hypothetical protein VHG51_00940 [Longimicrobiaceae bacterium]|nr:hypothetical protein [Longimicrobiaceae bacterium]